MIQTVFNISIENEGFCRIKVNRNKVLEKKILLD